MREWILVNREPRQVEIRTWALWFEAADRRVAQDNVGSVRISTVFLGLDHNEDDSGPPLLFETMIFGGPRDDETHRYATWAEAEAGHARLLAELEETR